MNTGPGILLEENFQYFSPGKAGEIRSRLKKIPVGDGLFRLDAEVRNESERTRKIKLILEAETTFRPDHYLIPCILYNGNDYGNLDSPRGLLRDGEPWVFAYDREGIPSCTVTEDASHVFALFASDESPDTLRSSCSLIRNADGTYRHRIFYPVTEAPVTYADKNRMEKRYDEWIELRPGAVFRTCCYLYEGKPRWKNYGFANVFDAAWGVLKHDCPRVLSIEDVWRLGIAFCRAMNYELDGKKEIRGAFGDVTHSIGNHIPKLDISPNLTLKDIEENPSLNFFRMDEYRPAGIGFSSQAFMNCRVQIADALRNHNEQQLGDALEILDGRLASQQKNGLILRPGETTTDPCHMGWGAAELARISRLLDSNGMDGSRFLESAEKLCRFFLAAWHDDFGFGKLWDQEGSCLNPTGSVGGFAVMGLCEVWRITRNPGYLACIRKAMEFYFRRDLARFICTAGAIDCSSVDKESAYPFLHSALILYEERKEPRFLEFAEQAGYYLCSWIFCYNVLYDEECDFTRLNYHTAGGTAISAEHHAIDPYGAVFVPDFLRLAEYTGHARWNEIGRLVWFNAIQCITTEASAPLHGLRRPPGAQNEGFFQARWTKYRSDCNARGHLNDYLGVWLSTFRLSSILDLESLGNQYAVQLLGDQ